MKSFINIEINSHNSLYKAEESPSVRMEMFSAGNTLNVQKNTQEINSSNTGSITGNALDGSMEIQSIKRIGVLRDIFIGTTSAVLGAVIVYFILGQ